MTDNFSPAYPLDDTPAATAKGAKHLAVIAQVALAAFGIHVPPQHTVDVCQPGTARPAHACRQAGGCGCRHALGFEYHNQGVDFFLSGRVQQTGQWLPCQAEIIVGVA